MEFNKEYFNNYYNYYLTDNGETFTLVINNTNNSNNINESNKKNIKMNFSKKNLNKVLNIINNTKSNNNSNSNSNSNNRKIKNEKAKVNRKISKNSEIEELVDFDGTLRSSKIPYLDSSMHPRKTTDQQVVANRMTNNPVTRGYRVYYGESVENDETPIKEVDYSEAYGYEETKEMDGKETYNYLIKKLNMNPEEAWDRTKQFGKDPSGKKDNNSEYKDDKNFVSRLTLSEIQRNKMKKMIEELILKKKGKNQEIQSKTKEDSKINKILMKNLQTIKKVAEKEGISTAELIKLLRQGE